MSHQRIRFSAPSSKHCWLGRLLPFVFGLMLLCWFWFTAAASLSPAKTQQLQQLEQAVRRSAVHCYAFEGRYPATLQELEERYALQYDHSQFRVDYEVFASNLMPVITVTMR